MTYVLHLIQVFWRERGNASCRAKYKRIDAEMNRWKRAREKGKA
jgi:hypothetical protein